MQKLEVMIPIWKKKARLLITQSGTSTTMTSVDINGSPYEMFSKVETSTAKYTGSQMATP